MKDTRELILQTAYNKFLYNNYEAVTINSIIKATGLTKGGIYYYFESKEELFKAVVDKYMIEYGNNTNSEFNSLKELIEHTIITVKGKLTRLIDNNSTTSSEIPVNYISLVMAAYRYYPGFSIRGNKYFKKTTKVWRTVMDKAISEKEIRSDIDIEATITNFINISSSVVINMLAGDSISYGLNIFERQYWEMYKNIKL